MQQLEKFNEWIGRTVAWLAAAAVALTFLVVALRYAFEYGRIDLQEAAVYLHAIVLMLCMSYTMKHDEHVRVDIFYQDFGERRRAWINLAGHLIFLLPVCGVILFTGWDYAANSWKILEKSPETGGLPLVFVLKSLPPVMAVLLLVQGTADGVRKLSLLRGGRK